MSSKVGNMVLVVKGLKVMSLVRVGFFCCLFRSELEQAVLPQSIGERCSEPLPLLSSLLGHEKSICEQLCLHLF